MTDTNRHIRSTVVSLDIDEVERNRRPLLDAHFSAAERRELAERHVRSTAGRLALKRAVCVLLQDRLPLAERDIVIRRLPKGPPELAVDLEIAGRLFVSISHSRKTAYGLAVLQEE